MKNNALKLIRHPLISGSAFIFFGSFLGNIFNFLFNLYMSRNLSPADYGTLASLISLVVLASMPAGSLLPLLIKFSASYFAKEEMGLAKGLFFKAGKTAFAIGFFILVMFIIFNSEISKFFNIDDGNLILIAGVTVFVAFVGTVTGAILQAKLLFKELSVINFIGALLKLVLGVSLVLLGLKLSGAMWGFALGYIVPFFFSFIPLKFLIKQKIQTSDIRLKDMLKYGGPSALALFGVTSLISTDILLVKHFYSSTLSGHYALLSLIGRIIFFFTGAISTVMFPMVVQKFTKGEDYNGIFRLALSIVLFPSILITLGYFIIPEVAIKIFNPHPDYLEIAPLLGWFGVYITIYSMLFVITNFFLSINKTKIAIPITFTAISQAILIWIFHKDFMQIIIISLVVSSLLLFVLLLYYFKLNRGKDKK